MSVRTRPPRPAPGGLRLLRRPPQRGQVDPDERARGHEGRDHLQPAADHPAHRPRHRAPPRRAARPRRHPRPAQAAHAARRAAQRRRADHLVRGRRHRLLPARRPEARPRRQVHRRGARGIKKTPKVAIVTKTDLVDSKTLAAQLLAIDQLGKELGFEWAEIVPVSAVGDSQVQLLADLLVPLLPESPPLYPEGDLTDEPEQVMVAELIREAALEGVRDELPHSIAVVVEEMIPREDRPADKPLLDIHANVYIERPSQKGIIIGPKGARLKEVGMKSRKHIEALLGTPVFLDLHVKVAKDWQRDPKQLRKLGF